MRRWIGVASLLFILAMVLVWYWDGGRTAKKLDEHALAQYERELSRAQLDPSAFVFEKVSRSDDLVVYYWRSARKSEAKLFVAASSLTIKFSGIPRAPDCVNDKTATIAAFGEVCR